MTKDTMKPRLAATLLAACAAAGLALGSAAPASAASADQVLVSSDGVHWGGSLDASLFDGLGRLVPGEQLTTNLWVKNPSDKAAVVRVSARDIRVSSAEFAENLTLSTWNSVDDSALDVILADAGKCQVLVDSQPLASGGEMKVTVTFALANVGEKIAQNDTADIAMLVAMRDAAAGPFEESACGDDGVVIGPDPGGPTSTPSPTPSTPTGQASGLAQTGAEAATPLLIFGGLVVGGTALVFLGRRRKSKDS